MSSLAAYVTAGVLLLAITAYSTAGGVDFGAGIWDLLAGRGKQGRQARSLVDHAMAPVWEVNNVWLVLGIVVCWTGFPILFESVFASLYPLFSIALVGLILRGAFFAFRHIAQDPRSHRVANLVFGLSSLLTPFFFLSIRRLLFPKLRLRFRRLMSHVVQECTRVSCCLRSRIKI